MSRPRVGFLECRRAILNLKRLRELVYHDFGYGTGLALARPLEEVLDRSDVPETPALPDLSPSSHSLLDRDLSRALPLAANALDRIDAHPTYTWPCRSPGRLNTLATRANVLLPLLPLDAKLAADYVDDIGLFELPGHFAQLAPHSEAVPSAAGVRVGAGRPLLLEPATTPP